MAIPDFQSLMLPVLRLAAQGPVRASDAIARLSEEFSLTETERQELLPGGRQTRVANRVYWAFIHLRKAELLKRESRGLYTLTEQGKNALQESPTQINIKFLLARAEKYRLFRRADGAAQTGEELAAPLTAAAPVEEYTPEERIETAFAELNAALQSDLYERVLAMRDADFERLIIALMLGLGYGAGGLGKRTGGPGDGAIDGIITEDVLGLDVIYLQAKRYAQDSGIGPDKIREFAGTMDAHGITKGVFSPPATIPSPLWNMRNAAISGCVSSTVKN